jgi:hypothetical protein
LPKNSQKQQLCGWWYTIYQHYWKQVCEKPETLRSFVSRLNIFFEDDPDDNGLDATGLPDDAQTAFDQFSEPYQDEDDELVLPARRSGGLEAEAAFARAMNALGSSVVFADSNIAIIPSSQYDAVEDSPHSKEPDAAGFPGSAKDVEANAAQAQADAAQADAAAVPDAAIESALVQVQETVLKVEAQLAQVQQSVMKVEAQLTQEPPQAPSHTTEAASQTAADDVVFPISPAPPRIILLPDTAAKDDDTAPAMPPVTIIPVAPMVVDTPAGGDAGAAAEAAAAYCSCSPKELGSNLVTLALS